MIGSVWPWAVVVDVKQPNNLNFNTRHGELQYVDNHFSVHPVPLNLYQMYMIRTCISEYILLYSSKFKFQVRYKFYYSIQLTFLACNQEMPHLMKCVLQSSSTTHFSQTILTATMGPMG